VCDCCDLRTKLELNNCGITEKLNLRAGITRLVNERSLEVLKFSGKESKRIYHSFNYYLNHEHVLSDIKIRGETEYL
jgi:hypothetical protein